MTPYANHHLHQSRATQDSPYDASITAACTKLYNDNAYNKDCAKTASSGGGGGGGGGGGVGDSNGYGLKDVWNTSAGNAGSGAGSVSAGQNASSVPVRPSACTPDSRVGGYLDTSGGSPVSRGGGGGSASGGGAASAWNASQCAIGGSTGQAAAASGLHQAGNHTFYPWMAIAGEFGNHTIFIIIYYLQYSVRQAMSLRYS